MDTSRMLASTSKALIRTDKAQIKSNAGPGLRKDNLIPGVESAHDPPPQTPPIGRPKASVKSASGIPKQVIGCSRIPFPGRPEVDLEEALGQLDGGSGGGCPPQELSYNSSLLKPGPVASTTLMCKMLLPCFLGGSAPQTPQ